MPFDIESAVELKEDSSAIPTNSFDVTTVQELNPPAPKKKPSPISSFLRSVFRNSPIEQIQTLQETKDMIPAVNKGESFSSYQNRVSDVLKPREEDIARQGVLRQIEAPMTVAVGAAGVVSPVATSLAVGGFSIADHFFNARRWIEDKAPDTPPVLKDIIEILDFAAKGAVVGGGIHFGKEFVMKRINDLNLPKAVLIEPQQVQSIKDMPVVSETLGIKPEHIEASANSNTPIQVPIENTIDLAMNSKWQKTKEALGEKKSEDVVSKGVTLEKTKGVENVKEKATTKAEEVVLNNISLEERGPGSEKSIIDSQGNVVGKLGYEKVEGTTAPDFSIEINENQRKKGYGTAAIQKVFDSGVDFIKGQITDKDKSEATKWWINRGAKVSPDGKSMFLAKEDFKPEPTSGDGIIKGPQKPKPESGLSKSIEKSAIKEGLSKDFGELPSYEHRNMDDIAGKVSEFINKDYELAKKIAFGEAPEQGGLRAQEIYTGIRVKALAEGDVNTLRELAVNEKASAMATELGQRVKALDSGDPNDPVGTIRQLQKVRKEASEKKIGKDKVVKEKKSEVAKIKKSVKEVVKKQDWAGFIKSLEC